MKNGIKQASNTTILARNISRNSLRKVSACIGAMAFCLTLLLAPAVFAADQGAKVPNKAAQVQEVPAQVNINKASAEQMAAVLKGVGLKKAESIVSWRKANGKFNSIEQLAEVKGIGEETVKKNRGKLLI